MKWHSQRPRQGDQITVCKFAWYPVRIDDTTKAWLCRYWELRVFNLLLGDKWWSVLARWLTDPALEKAP